MTQIAIGPILTYWPREAVLAFYADVAESPADIVYLGETVCSRRHELRLPDWLEIATTLHQVGKKVVLSTLGLIESASELKMVRRIASQTDFQVEANDMSAVHLLLQAGCHNWVAGAALNIFNARTLAQMQVWGATRWVRAPEISAEAGQAVNAALSQPIENEVLVWGRIPLAHSARCFTARHYNLQKDSCEFRCLGLSDGLVLKTREGENFLTLNGVQTQSSRILNLSGDFNAVSAAVEIIRIQPQGQDTMAVVDLFDQLRHHRVAAAAAFEMSKAWLFDQPCNGFWHGQAGAQLCATAP